MQRNRSATTVVSEKTAQAALRRAPARELEADEERATRMRLGASVPAGAPLERKRRGNDDAEIEILAGEIEMFLRMRDELRAHAARRKAAAARATTASTARATVATTATARTATRPSATKAKIVRALRKKG